MERGGDTLNVVISVAIAIAVFNAVIAIQIQIARLIFASARDRSWPDAVDGLLGAIHPRTSTPIAATVLVGLLAAICGYFVPFEWLLIATGASVAVVYVVTLGVGVLWFYLFIDRQRGERWTLPNPQED